MKRFVLVAAVGVAGIFAAIAGAQVSQTIYEGKFDGQHRSKVRVHVSQDASGNVSLRSFSARRFDVHCEGGVTAQMKKVVGRGEVPVGGLGRFRFADDNGTTVLKIAGDVASVSVGRFRYSGLMDAGGGERLLCDSGRIFWAAR